MCGRKMFTMWVLINAAREMIDVYWMEINYVYYVGRMYMTWSYNCLLKGGKGWLLQKHGNGYSTGELNGCG